MKVINCGRMNKEQRTDFLVTFLVSYYIHTQSPVLHFAAGISTSETRMIDGSA